MRLAPSVILLVVLAALLLYMIAGTRQDAQGEDSGPQTPPYAVTE
ncbi:hypothetical protein [Pseudotabrizicola formosa]|nr:hypothetical protein [Pseudotabrizicola formosa]